VDEPGKEIVHAEATNRPGLVEEYIQTTGAILGGRDGWDAFPDPHAVYGGDWSGPIFVLTHHPEDAEPAEGVTFLSCDIAEAVQIARRAAGGKNVEVLSPTIGRQLLERGLLDEIDLHVLPVLLGDGLRLYDNPGGSPVPLEFVNGDPVEEINLRYRTVSCDCPEQHRASGIRTCWQQAGTKLHLLLALDRQ
jgi:dihydrofolate reductase